MEKIRLVVYDDCVLGYVIPEIPNSIQILHSSVLRGSCNSNEQGSIPLTPLKTLRTATEKDFNEFNVSFIGYNKESYIFI